MKISVIDPIGFCAGVRRAVNMFYDILAKHEERPIYVLHELVHNRSVSEKMRGDGALFVEQISQVPDGSVVLLGAHGCGLDVERECRERHLIAYDAVCPLVKQLQQTAARHRPEIPLILLGDKEHPEVKSVVNRAGSREVHVIGGADELPPPMGEALFLSQTTRNAAEVEAVRQKLAERIGNLESRAHVCDAVLLRQKAVERLSRECELMLIIGSMHSSNARRLLEIASGITTAYMVETARDIQDEWLQGVQHVGVGAGTSTPDWDITQVREALEGKYCK